MPEELEVQTKKDIRRIESAQINLDLQKENKRLIKENTELTVAIHEKLDKLLTDVNEIKVKQSDMEEKSK